MNKKKVALYCRLSTEDENSRGKESESIQNQKQLLCNYAQKQGWEIYKIYSDEDYSGLDDKRPAFCNMLQEGQKKCFSIILCKTQSRLTRNLETAERLLHRDFLQWGIRFVTIVDHVDTDSKENKKARQINSLVNEWYCEEISENIRAVFRRKMELGQFVGNYAPYGYYKNPENRHQLLVEEETAEMVRLIFHLYLTENLSCRKIANFLTQKHIPTPWQKKLEQGKDTGRKNVVHPGIWSDNTIRKILKNRVYLGDMVQGRERKLSYKDAKVIAVPQEEWIIVENTHKAIISKKQFDEVQKKLSGRWKKQKI